MTEATNLQNLYSESGISAITQAQLRHFASRIDAHQRWVASGGVGPEPEVPNFEQSGLGLLGFSNPLNDPGAIINYRTQVDANGNPGAYCEIHFTNTNMSNTFIRVIVGTDVENDTGPLAVLGNSPDALVNKDLGGIGSGIQLQRFLGQYISNTIQWFESGDENTTFIDISESLGGCTVPIGHAIADKMQPSNYVSYTYNPRSLTGANALRINNWLNDENSVLRGEIFGTNNEGDILLDSNGGLRMDPLQWDSNNRLVLSGGYDAFFLIMDGDLVGNSSEVPLGGDLRYLQMPVSLDSYITLSLSDPTFQNSLDGLSDNEKSEAIENMTSQKITEYETALHVSETLQAPESLQSPPADFFGYFLMLGRNYLLRQAPSKEQISLPGKEICIF